MRKIIILILILFPNKSFADQGLEISCLNLKSALFGRKYKPLNFKLRGYSISLF
jgi:hypothetical protein